MYVPTFAELVGNGEEFLAMHFGRLPLLRRDALTGVPDELLSIADLDEYLHQEALRNQYLRVVVGGDLIHESTYTGLLRVQGKYIPDCVIPARVYEHFRAGASILWHSMNHFRPNLRALNAMLSRRFATRSESLAFLTPAGRKGFVIHHDPNDTFVIHLHGRKRWRVWPTREVTRPNGRAYRVGEEYRPEHLGEPLWNVLLSPGDVMYLPQGTPHEATADDTVSLHLTVTVTPRRWSELVRSMVAHLLPDQSELRGFPHLHEDMVETQATFLQEQIDSLVRKLQAVDPKQEVRRLIAEGRTTEGIMQGSGFAQTAAIDKITEKTRVSRSAGANITFSDEMDGRISVSINGHVAILPKIVAEALRSDHAPVGRLAGEYVRGASTQDSVKAVRILARLDAIEICGHSVAAEDL